MRRIAPLLLTLPTFILTISLSLTRCAGERQPLSPDDPMVDPGTASTPGASLSDTALAEMGDTDGLIANDIDFSAPGDPVGVVSGIYASEGVPWRWTRRETILRLGKPGARRLRIAFAVPEIPTFRQQGQSISVRFNDANAETRCCFGPGLHEVEFQVPADIASEKMVVRVQAGRTFIPASLGGSSDQRELGLILRSVRLAE